MTDVNTNCTHDETQRCDVIQHEIFNECRKHLGNDRIQEHLKSCKIDACIYHNDSKVLDKVVCEAIEGFTRECEQEGFTIDWRGVSKCGKVYSRDFISPFPLRTSDFCIGYAL